MTAKKPAVTVPPMNPQTRAALLRAARGQISAASAGAPMGIRYRTPTPPARPAAADHRPWTTLSSPAVLEEIAEIHPRAAGTRRQPRPAPPAAPCTATAQKPSAGHGHTDAPATADQHITTTSPDADPPVLPPAPGATTDSGDHTPRVLRRFDAHACEACGSRYTRPGIAHECGPLTPVTVTITASAGAQAWPGTLIRYDAYACEPCDSRWGHDVPGHGCGPLTPVVVTIRARTEGEHA